MDSVADPQRRPSRIGVFVALWLGVIAAVIGLAGQAFGLWTRIWPDPDKVSTYMTTDPDVPPALQSTSDRIIGIEIPGDISDIGPRMPKDAEYEVVDLTESEVAHHWDWMGVGVYLTASRKGETTALRVSRSEVSGYIVSMPRGLLLGHSTTAEILMTLGHPDQTLSEWVDGYTAYYLIYDLGDKQLAFVSEDSRYEYGESPHTLDDRVCDDKPDMVVVATSGSPLTGAGWVPEETAPHGEFCGVPWREDQVS